MSDERTKSPKGAQDLVTWLLTEGRNAKGVGQMLAGLCQELVASGMPVDRATMGNPLFHPVAQSAFCSWDTQNGLTEISVVWNDQAMARIRNSPMHGIYGEGVGVDWRLVSDDDVARFEIGRELRAAGFTHYLAFALPFTDRTYKGFTVQTKQKNGFSTAQKDHFTALIPAITATAEHHVQRALAKTLLNTFVGERSGVRVLDGQIHRGDGEFINAVIWMSDLRGFTHYAANSEPEALLAAINFYFEAVSTAIMYEGGEVLKFIGDAVLGIFPMEGDGKTEVASAERAADRVIAAQKRADWPTGLGFGLGLHAGDVFYGNVGGQSRLDFTVIGQAVNLVSRIESLCRNFDCPLVVSEEIVSRSERTYQPKGPHLLKGFSEPVLVFAATDE